MRVLVLYECSGIVRDMFIACGHEAVSVDLLPTMKRGPHFQMDVWAFLKLYPAHTWDLIIAHPECTFLTISGLHWNEGDKVRRQKTEDAVENFGRLLRLDCPRLAVENPVGCISTRIRNPNQMWQPYQFGDDASKKTCFWTKGGLPKLVPTMRKAGRMVWDEDIGCMMERWDNQNDKGQNKLGPSADRWLKRSIFYPGMSAAMAYHWGGPSLRASLFYSGFQIEQLSREMAHVA